MMQIQRKIELGLYIMNGFCIQMSLQLISIPGCDSKSLTISLCPFCEAEIKAVVLNIGIQCHKCFKIEIA